MISLTAEYALRAVSWLANHGDEPLVSRDIAEATQVPSGYLSKVLQSLGRAGLVNSQRGLGGGFVLSRPADEITVLDVVNAVDPLERIETCPLNIEHTTKLCPLHRHLDTVLGLVEKAFRETTIAEIVQDVSGTTPLCRQPDKAISV